jgi:hypothetical protein
MQRANNEHILQTIAHLKVLQVYHLRSSNMLFSLQEPLYYILS